MGFNPTIIALLTAFVSVLATAMPNLVTWFKGEYSDLKISYVRDDHSGGIIFEGYNGGNRPGAIKDITLDIPLKNPKTPVHYKGKMDEFFLPAQSGKPIRVIFDVKIDRDKFVETDFDGKCTFTVEKIEFSAEPSQLPAFKVPCQELSVICGKDDAYCIAPQ